MKKLPLSVSAFLFFPCCLLYSQQSSQIIGKSFEIGQRKVFIENKGQFHPPGGQDGIVMFAYDEGSSKIYFTSKGLIYSFNKVSWKKDPDKDSRNSIGEEEENEKPEIKSDLVSMEWLNANNTVEIIAEEKAPDYFSYSVKENGSLKNINHISGYQKLIYKNLYPGIDVEYVFHNGEGLEYSLILHPGADISKVQMRYSSSHKLHLSHGNIYLPTVFGNIIDHAPSSFYSGKRNEAIESEFKILNNNTVAFTAGNYDNTKEVTIDPWTITPSFPNSNKIWNCQTDATGNVYLYGGDSPLLLRKYTSTNTLLWTYTTTWDSSTYWLGTLITSRAGISYISSGANGEIAEINTSGGLVWFNNPNGILLPDYEYWHMALNCNQTQLAVSGTILPTLLPSGFMGEVFNIDLTNGSIASSVTIGYEFGLFSIDEGRSICSSPNGNYYFLTLDSIGSVTAPPFALNFKAPNSYNFSYGSPSYAVTGNMGQNAIKATQNFIYTQNGTNINQRDITNGSILLTATIPGGISSSSLGTYSPGNSGLDIDSCGNVYVGSSNQVVEYDANLNQVNTTTTPSAVYDVAVNNNGEVIACGDGFAMSIAFSACKPPAAICNACNPPSLATSHSNIKCNGGSNGSATVTVSGSSGSYTFSWSPAGGTNATATGLSAGTYTCTVTDSSGCNSVTSVVITQPPAITATFISAGVSCYGYNNGLAEVTASGGTSPYTYSWAPFGGTNATATGLNPGTYTVTITDSIGCLSLSMVTITQPPKIVITLSGKDSICTGDSASINAGGGGTYLWSTGATNSTLNIIPPSSATYTLTVTVNGCSKDTTVSITVSSPPVIHITQGQTICSGDAITLSASGGGEYRWSTGSTNDSIVVSPISGTSYSVTVFNGCTVSASTFVGVDNPTISACCDTTIQPGNSINLNASGSGIVRYNWIPADGLNCDTCSVVIASPTVTTTYTVTGTDSLGCTTEKIIIVTVEMSCSDLIVPNVFTPNGDNINDVFKVTTGKIDSYSIEIFDRWGKEMYKSTDPNQSWNGKDEGGGSVIDGVYYYIVQSVCQNNTYKKQGFVQVIH